MKIFVLYLILVIILSIFSLRGFAHSLDSATILSIDPPDYDGHSIIQQLNYQSSITSISTVRIQCYQQRDGDKLCVYDMEFEKTQIKNGTDYLQFNFSKNTKLYSADYSFLEVVKKFDLLPPGNYITDITISIPDSGVILQRQFKWYFDSTLSTTSPLRKDINATFSSKSLKEISVKKKNPPKSERKPVSKEYLKQSSQKVNSSVGKRKGVVSTPVQHEGKNYSALYYKEWFLGYYEITDNESMKDRIARENTILKTNPGALISNNLESFTSISSQSKKVNKETDKNDLTGNINIIGNFSTGQETGSKQDNNYQEVYGDFNTEIMKIPVVIEGYYSTQDNNRAAKASYLRIRYDIEKSKNDLRKNVNGYTGKYEETQSR